MTISFFVISVAETPLFTLENAVCPRLGEAVRYEGLNEDNSRLRKTYRVVDVTWCVTNITRPKCVVYVLLE